MASARSVVSIRERLGDLPLQFPIIEFNGAMISDYQTGEHVWVNHIAKETMAKLHEIVMSSGCDHFISTVGEKQDWVTYTQVTNEGMHSYLKDREYHNDPRMRKADSWGQAHSEKAVCLTAVGRKSEMAQVQVELNTKTGEALVSHLWEDSYTPGWYWLMIHDVSACKGNAARQVMELSGMADCELIAFGDQVNDLSLMDKADRGLAVSNAAEILKERASEVIGSHINDAVVRWIQGHQKVVNGEGAECA